ncbi:MAG: hypothetical protein V1809_13595 [Planctomycetota bacterium]
MKEARRFREQLFSLLRSEGEKGGDAALVELARLGAYARQRMMSGMAARYNLSSEWVGFLNRVVLAGETASSPREGRRHWQYFLETGRRLQAGGATPALLEDLRRHVQDIVVHEASGGGEFSGKLADFSMLDILPCRGLDVGTTNIVGVVRRKGNGLDCFNLQRNAFLDVRSDAFTGRMLQHLGIPHILHGGRGFVVGDAAFELANIFQRNTRRPMKDGLISPLEQEALRMVEILIQRVLGKPRREGELCAFSVPADPTDSGRNVIYHRGALESLLHRLGFTPKAVVEGHAVVFSELEESDYTGIGISCGGGMFNVCLSYKSVPAVAFSTSRGGDWIDENVAASFGMTTSEVCSVKEGGVDLLKPGNRVEEAIVIYYRNLIQYTLQTIRERFESGHGVPSFQKPVDIVLSGGTSLAGNFTRVFREELEKSHLPIDVAEVRLARDPLRSVARGCLQAAVEEMHARLEIEIPL